MSDNNLRLQVILNAVDKLTRPFRSAQASSRELAAAVKKSRDAIKQLDQAGSSLDSFRKLQAENQKLGDRLNYARQRANLLSQELGAMGPPSQRQVVALGRQRLAVQRLEERQKKLQQQTALVRAELYRAGISAKDDAGATARLARETSRYNQELSKQEARLKRLGEAQRRMNAARASYARSLEVRDRIAGAGATTTAAGLAMGAPVMAAVKSYTSMEDAMKGVAKQVNGLRDDNGNRTARFYEMQDAIKAASEQLPMENGAVDFAALVEGGARMNVAKGAFTVDEIEHTGAPDRLTIRARSADFRETLNTRREKSWHKTTVGEVVKEIAARHKLKMALGKDLSDKPVEHIDQTNESDGSFLMRLARQYGAIASVKNGNLLFIRQGQGKSASGKPLPVITITRKDGDSHRFTLADRGAYTGVIASWLHTREPAKKESTAVKRKRRTKKQKKEPETKQGDYLVGTDENVLVLNRTYANRSNAERAAKMQWERLQRGVASFSLQLAEGRADLYTEMPVKVSGFKQPIDDAEWTITTLTHTVSPDNGFTTSLELEVRIDDFEME